MPGIPYNRTQVISTALSILGYPITQSIQAGGPSAAALDLIYDPILAADLSSPNWRFANKTAQLSLVAGVNPKYSWYTSEYQIPPDCLAIWQLFPNVPYEVFGERIWTTGTQEIMISYRALLPESKMPAAYIMYLCYLIALAVAPGVIQDDKIIARLEAEKTKWRSQAMIVNTQGRPNQGLSNSPWVGSRPGGSFYGTGWVVGS